MKSPVVKYLGRTTHRIYQWSSDTVPAALKDANGNPVASGTFAGETVVGCNSQDGSVQRGTAGTPPAQDPFSTGYSPSIWEQLQ